MGQLLTFTDQQNICTGSSGFSDATTLVQFKRDINTGAAKLMAALGRSYTRRSRFADQTASVQYYQFPKDAFRLRIVLALNGTTWQPLTKVSDEAYWRMITQGQATGIPTMYFVRGADEFGVYPIPSADVADGLELVFELRHIKLTQDDVTTGTVTVAENDGTVTHSATIFTNAMVGRAFEVTDGSDGNWYRIASRTSSSVVELDNVFQGPSASGVAFRIGEVMDLPEEFLESPCDYALWRFFLGRNGARADTYKQLFEDAKIEARATYGRHSSGSLIVAEPNQSVRAYDPLRGNPTTLI